MAYSETYCSRDARGILRGKCLACVGCFCYHVILRDKNIKCISCGHPPGQHAKREDESMDVEQNTLSEICALETCSGRVRYDPQLQTNFPRCRDEYIVSTYNPNATSLGSDAIHGGNNMPQHAAQSSEFNLHAYAGYIRQPEGARNIKQCANERCKGYVHVDQGLPQHMQEFQHCSPDCRDKVLQHDASKSTMKMIASLETNLLTIDDHSLSEYISRNPGPCSSCSVWSKIGMSSQSQELAQQGDKMDLGSCASKHCRRSVHVDHELPRYMQEFQYCSPNCRDEDMQNKASKITNENILSLETKFRGTFDNRSLSQYITRNPGPCSSCSEKSKSGAANTVKNKHSQATTNEVTKKGQENVRVRIMKDALMENVGIILYTIAYNRDKVHGFKVAGIRRHGAAFKGILKNKDESIWLLDIITSVENIPFKSPAKFNDLTVGLKSVVLDCHRTLGIQLNSEVLHKVKDYTHVFGLRCTMPSPIGITVQRTHPEVRIEVKEDTIAKYSGLKTQDIIKGYVMATKKIDCSKIVECKTRDKFTKCIEEAEKKKLNLILFVQRT